ncbi:MAG: glycosyltransferase family 9 protein [Chthoniobacterales bacterium]
MKRILVIRGGAIGDFILTLPALRALREAYPAAHFEILGYKHIVALAEDRYYAQAVRSIEYAPLSSFFAKNSEPAGELADHFASFDLILSYLYDPDGIFEMNLRRCGVENLLRGPSKLDNSQHAARQLSRPLEELGIATHDFSATIFPSPQDRQFAHDFLRDVARPIVAIHPGSGSETKNWPLRNWIELGNDLLGRSAPRSGGLPATDSDRRCSGERRSLVIVSGEADQSQVAPLESIWKNERVAFAKNLPLPQLAAVLEQTTFLGHDSGISHLAAAAGANCILLFGPTDPKVWAPQNDNVHVIRAPDGELRKLEVDLVRAALRA